MGIGNSAGYLTVAASVLLSLLAARSGVVRGFDNLVYGHSMSQGAPMESQAPLALVKIDDATLDAIHDPLVLWPGRFAAVITNLSLAGAEVVAVVHIPSVSLDEHAPQLDASLVKAIAESRTRGTRVIFGFSEKPGAIALPHSKYRSVLSGVGLLDLTPDPDDAARRYVYCHSHGDGGVDPSLALAAVFLRSAGEDSLQNLGKNPAWPCLRKAPPSLVDYRRRIPEESIFSFIEVLRTAGHEAKDRLAKGVKGKIVLVGGVSPRLEAFIPVPFNPYDPHSRAAPETIIHLQAAETLLQPEPIRAGAPLDDQAAAMLCAAIFSIIMMRFSARTAAITALAAAGAWAWRAMAEFGAPFYYSPWPPAAGALAAFPVTGLYIYLREFRLRSQLARHFKSYVSQEVMEKIMDSPESVDFGGKLVYATVMFADIRSFTSISERLEPHQVVAGLNKYFAEMTAAITESGGYVNKYMGDGILAIFGAPSYDPAEGALAAAWGAVKMQKAADKLNKEGIFPGFPEIRMGVGLHCGEAIVGNIGCSGKMDYSIIGDTVNTAARVEGLTKDYGAPILLTESLFLNLKGKVEAVHLGASLVKGKERHINIYTLKSIWDQREKSASPPPIAPEEKKNNEEPMDSGVEAGD